MKNTRNDGSIPRSYVLGPDGGVLTLGDLPTVRLGRWVSRRKAIVVAAVRGGLISLDAACHRYEIAPEEFLAWQSALDQFGLKGLEATKQRVRVGRPDGESSPSAPAPRAPLGWR